MNVICSMPDIAYPNATSCLSTIFANPGRRLRIIIDGGILSFEWYIVLATFTMRRTVARPSPTRVSVSGRLFDLHDPKYGLVRLRMRSLSSSNVRAFTSRAGCLRHAAFFVVMLAFLPSLTKAQEATIVGTVTDPSGGVIASVTVTIVNEQTGAARALSTNVVGQYVVPGLPVGAYDLRAEASGFKLVESKGVLLNTNDRVRVDFQMQVGAHSETAVVESTAVAVQADSGEQSSLISGTQMSELSTNGRSIYTYAALTPGAASLIPSFEPPTPIGANGNVSFNGNRTAHNIYLLDGGENDDRGGAGSSLAPSIDAIAEMQTLTSNYSAEYGLSSAGTVSSVLKSGTRTFHFSLWEFLRNDALDARNFFNPAPQPITELRYNLYGFNVGGPVTFGRWYNRSKTRTFFFYNMNGESSFKGRFSIRSFLCHPLTVETFPLQLLHSISFTRLLFAKFRPPSKPSSSWRISRSAAARTGFPTRRRKSPSTTTRFPQACWTQTPMRCSRLAASTGGYFRRLTVAAILSAATTCLRTCEKKSSASMKTSARSSLCSGIWLPNRSRKTTALPYSAATTCRQSATNLWRLPTRPSSMPPTSSVRVS